MLVSIVQAVSQVTAVYGMARPTILAFVPIVMADPTSTFADQDTVGAHGESATRARTNFFLGAV